jgi:transposase
MKKQKHTIKLSKKDLVCVSAIIRKGKHSARVVNRARILFYSHRGQAKDDIAKNLDIGRSTVQRIRDRYRKEGIEYALYDDPRPGQPKKITDEGEAYLIALATSNPPQDRDCWTMELLKEKMVEAGKAPKEITTVALWKRLDQREIKPWREKNVVHS